MTFHSFTFENFVSQSSAAQSRLFTQYLGERTDFDIIVVGSGMGGGVLADDLADRGGAQKRILVLEAGSFLYPTHVYNLCRFPNSDIARHFACKTFWQYGDSGSQHYIHEQPQLNFGGRSIFWSGLIPRIQDWELHFFPESVRQDLDAGGGLDDAGRALNESATMGDTAEAIVKALRASPLANDFEIEQTPRALHQPYLASDGTPQEELFVEPTGVFNTAELLINQVGLAPGVHKFDGPGLFLLLDQYVEDLQDAPGGRLELLARSTLDGSSRRFQAETVVLAGGSIESPKLLQRSTLGRELPNSVQALIGRGLTDHPTTDGIKTLATHCRDVPLPKNSHAKVVLYSKGLPNAAGEIEFPFNIEMNVNHEYWHLRENDPRDDGETIQTNGPSIVDFKFSFGNCLDHGNEVRSAPPFGYVPEVAFKNLNWMDHLCAERFPALAAWNKSAADVFGVLNTVADRILAEFSNDGQPATSHEGARYGENFVDFGFGTVHHAVGTLRMPHRTRLDGPFQPDSVVDEDLRVIGTRNLFVCDMSVMPFSSAANPVRTLVALALRLSKHLR